MDVLGFGAVALLSGVSLVSAGGVLLYGYSFKPLSLAAKKGTTSSCSTDDLKLYSELAFAEEREIKRKKREKLESFLQGKNKRSNVFKRGCSTLLDALNVVKSVGIVLIPGVNVVAAYRAGKKHAEIFLDLMEKDGAVRPLTDSEKEEYRNAGAREKVRAALMFSLEDKMVVNGKPLEEIGYSIDDVERLSKVTDNHNYRIGTVDGKNVAVVGVSDLALSSGEAYYIQDNSLVPVNFEEMSYEDAQNKSFVVYPFRQKDDLLQALNSEVQAIKDERLNMGSAVSDLEISDAALESFIESPFADTARLDSQAKEGPSLVKKTN